jgi:SAM-dependent methyltransferase
MEQQTVRQPLTSDRAPVGWTAFWNGQTTIYVSEHHKRVHYQQIADDICQLVPNPHARVLDFGCGEALAADRVASACGTLVLCDAAETVRSNVAARWADHPNITVVSPADLARIDAGSFDLIVANSVVQYMGRTQLQQQLSVWRRLLSPQGILVLGDIIPVDVSAVDDATALLRFAHANKFLTSACAGLLRTLFSDYRQKRAELGLLRFSEAEIIDLVHSCGFDAQRQSKNIGHNPSRMTIRAHVTRQPLACAS